MTAEAPAKPAATDGAATQPAIVLTFEGPGAAGFSVSAIGITPAQLYAAATYIRELASATFAGELRQRAALGLVAAGPTAMDDLRRSGRV